MATFGSWRSGVDPKTRCWPKSWEHTSTWTARQRMHFRSCKSGRCAGHPGHDSQFQSQVRLIDGLGPNGTLVVVGAGPDPIEAPPALLFLGNKTIQGWASGTPAASEDTLNFCVLSGVRPMIETYPFERTAEAYARMLSGNAQSASSLRCDSREEKHCERQVKILARAVDAGVKRP